MTKEEILRKKVGFISLGCDKNRVDLEDMIFNIQNAGFEIVNNPANANIIIVNTCAFLESSRLETIENILEMSEYKNQNLEKLIVTGCLNELNYSDLSSSLPEVDIFVNIKDNDKIVSKIFSLYSEIESSEHIVGRVLTTPNHYAYIKIAEGCNNFCSYCLIPFIRGRYRSRAMEDIIAEANDLANKGVKELIIVAQDVTKYGIDIYNKKCLHQLLAKLSEIENIRWIRLLYCYPEEIDEDLISEIKNNDKIIKYLDIPLQHISNGILKSMNRKSTKEGIYQLFSKLKNEIPSIVLRTTFILGFPGETDNDINEIAEFLKIFRLDNVGFFKYSREEGTRSYNFENQIDEETKEKRLEYLSQIQFEIQQSVHSKLCDQVLDVVIDDVYDYYSIGRYYGQCPQIDSYIAINKRLTIGNFYKVKITEINDYDLIGEIYEYSK